MLSDLPQLSRRSFLYISSKVFMALGLSSFFLNSWEKAFAADRLEAFFVRQIITEDSRTSRKIAWESTVSEIDAAVDLQRADEREFSSFAVREKVLNDGGEKFFSHEALLTGLLPETSYMYRLRTGDIASSWFSLHTASDNVFKALIFPDSQCSDGYQTWRNVAENAASQHQDADFFIMMGDLVDNGEAAYQWRQWFKGAEGLISRMPCAPLMGNHEVYDLNWQCRLPWGWLGYFPVPQNDSSRFSGWYYSFDYGSCHFAVLNTQWEEVEQLRSGLLEEQVDWLRRDLAATGKKWKIVLMHKDIIEYDYPDLNDLVTGDISTTGRVLLPLFDELRPDVVLTAHQHTYRRLGHILHFAPSSEGPFYIDTGNCGNCYYDVAQNKRFDQKMLVQPERGNYMTLAASKDSLCFQCFLPDGSLVDEAILKK